MTTDLPRRQVLPTVAGALGLGSLIAHAGKADAAPGEATLATELTEELAAAYRDSGASFARVAKAVAALAGPEAGRQALADSVLYTFRWAASGVGYTMECDPAYPTIERFQNYRNKGHGISNVDCSYHHAALDGRYTYRIRGSRGTARLLDAETSTLNIGDDKQAFIDSFGRQGIEIPPGGEVDLVLSKEPHDGLWLKLADGPCFIVLRQYFYDWDTEEPARLIIEREGATYPPPMIAPEMTAERVRLTSKWMNCEYQVKNRLTILGGPLNTLVERKFPQAFLQTNRYLMACVLSRPDEAVILETTVPEAAYWSVCLTDAFGTALEPHMRQVSINGHQASLDADGRFRAVIAHTDPGVKNWLDSGGRAPTIAMLRFNKAASSPETSMRVVPLSTVRQHLPKDTAVVTAAERQDSLRRRLRSAYRRDMLDY